ncbi:MAG: amidophosphoribosyltransferase [Tissierellia bacterium]|nr:amidophosphoribosyltransferase [Tissierellia bacterium]
MISKNNTHVSRIVYYGLYGIQHRGQVCAGMAVNNNGFIDYFKELGLVHEVFTQDKIDRLMGKMAIGHVNTNTGITTSNSVINAQPLVVGYKRGGLALVHDGAIVNYKKLKQEMEDGGAIFQSQLDGEVIAMLIARFHKDSIEDAIIQTLGLIKGSYSFIIMTNDCIFAARDPFGMKPLSIGKLGEDYVLSSETCGFETVGAKYVRDVAPGELIAIDENGVRTIQHKPFKRKLCFFETIYFSRPDSLIDGESIYLSRIESGRELARQTPVDADIVIGAPDSGIVAAIGYAEESGIPYAEGIIKNRYVGRTFIQPTQEIREMGVRIKLNPLKENINGKRVILVDDSVVRGTTIKQTVKMLRDDGAKEVHIRIASPPVKRHCYLGMDTPTEEHLIAAGMSVSEIEKSIEADSLGYISLEGLSNSMIYPSGFCTGCFNGDYPIAKE